MQGEVVTVSPDGDGVVRADDDARYAFHTRDVRVFIVQVGDRIGFEVDGDRAADLTLLSASPIPSARPCMLVSNAPSRRRRPGAISSAV